LLERCEDALAALEQFNAADQQRIQDVLKIITSGQELDLRRFAGASEQNIVALANAAELDDYTYRVAGCVGEFWTKMCRTHLFPRAAMDDQNLLTDGVKFGKGLQLVNILRDIPKDLRQGRCYLPKDELLAAKLSPKDLLDPANEPKLRPIYNRHLAQAQAFLAAGWTYTNSLPRRFMRVRLACAWPILIGMKTIQKLRTGNVLDPAQRIKISRSELKGIVLRSALCHPFPPAWRRLFPGQRASRWE
jgi:farnesyl-diphosphate farnesyltransferase